MAILKIPTPAPTDLYVDQITQLEGVEYLLLYQWNARLTSMFLSFFDQDQNPLAVGIRLVVLGDTKNPDLDASTFFRRSSLLHRFKNPLLPQGVLFCQDLSGKNKDIETPEDLGTRVGLFYITSDDALIA